MDKCMSSCQPFIIGMLLFVVVPLLFTPPLTSVYLVNRIVASCMIVLSIACGIAMICYRVRERAEISQCLAMDPWIETEQNELGEHRYVVCVYELKSETTHWSCGADTIDGCGPDRWSEYNEWLEVVRTIYPTKQLAEQDLAKRMQEKHDAAIAQKRNTWNST